MQGTAHIRIFVQPPEPLINGNVYPNIKIGAVLDFDQVGVGDRIGHGVVNRIDQQSRSKSRSYRTRIGVGCLNIVFRGTAERGYRTLGPVTKHPLVPDCTRICGLYDSLYQRERRCGRSNDGSMILIDISLPGHTDDLVNRR